MYTILLRGYRNHSDIIVTRISGLYAIICDLMVIQFPIKKSDAMNYTR